VTSLDSITGRLKLQPARDVPELLAEPVRVALTALPDQLAARCWVAEIDPDLADTAALCEHYQVPLQASANCVVVTGKRSGMLRWAGCVVLATTRADVNGVVRRRLDVRKASFAAQDEAVNRTGMEYGGITPLGLPDGWPVLVDACSCSSRRGGRGFRCAVQQAGRPGRGTRGTTRRRGRRGSRDELHPTVRLTHAQTCM
jgi:prolyl-tRNA editing enzyme YbaK/EbsC (Cys-tRNA(Pro) deacylase)